MKKHRTKNRAGESGFSLIELIVVVTIIGILASVAVVQVRHTAQKARETALKDNLFEMRKAIDNFYADKQHYPNDLNELVPNYLRKIPKDPITNSEDWEVIQDNPTDPNAAADTNTDNATQNGPGVIDVKSKAPGHTLDNVPYSDL